MQVIFRNIYFSELISISKLDGLHVSYRFWKRIEKYLRKNRDVVRKRIKEYMLAYALVHPVISVLDIQSAERSVIILWNQFSLLYPVISISSSSVIPIISENLRIQYTVQFQYFSSQ